MYGPIPIVDVNLPVASTPDEVRTYREPVEDVAKYIVDLLDEAAKDLSSTILNEAQELGRVTKPVALAVKAQVLTLMASPQFNGHEYFRSLKDNRGTFLFPQSEDRTKWAAAAQAIKEAIDCAEQDGNRRLYTYTGFYEINSPSTQFELSIRGALTEPWNREIIWGATGNPLGGSKSTDYIQRQSIPRIIDEVAPNISTLSVTMDMVERFYTKNGVPIDEDKTLRNNYVNRYNLQRATSDYKYLMEEGFETAVLHFDRENRFYASVIFDGGLLFGCGNPTDNPERANYIHMKSGQPAGRLASEKYSVTGYLPKKTINLLTQISSNGRTYTFEPYSFPYIRLADLYLLYAEALNEVNGPGTEVYKYIDTVRARAGLKGVVESWNTYSTRPDRVTSKDEMRKIIHQERLIELAFEEAPYWDIMRWMEAEQRWNAPIKGWNAFGSSALTFYELTTVAQSTFPVREYFAPIRQSELDKNINLVQNPRW
jgi:hypothetical protein